MQRAPPNGLLLDTLQPNWRNVLGVFTPADLLTVAVRAHPGDAQALRRTTDHYGGPAIADEERERAAAQAARLASIRSGYTQGPRLELPLTDMLMEFDPNQVTPVEGIGSFYRVLTIRDARGELRATQGAVISAHFTRVVVPAPEVSGLSGPGWTLGLRPTYVVGPTTISGARTVVLETAARSR